MRKSLHINTCLDHQEAEQKFAENKEKWTNTLDCPMCGEPLPPGPVRGGSFLNLITSIHLYESF